MIECTDKRLEKEEYEKYYNEINNIDNLQKIFNYFNHYNKFKYNIGVSPVPNTKYKNRL